MTPEVTVLFASTETFEAGDQLAACLRRRGVRVELFRPPAVGTLAKGLRLASGLVYDRVDESLIDEPTGPELSGLAAAVARPGVVAVQATDTTLEPLVGLLAADPHLVRRVCAASDPQGMVDKRWQARVAAAVGLRVPAVWDRPAEVTSFPVLVKPILGGGGEGIRRAASAEELAQAWQEAALDDRHLLHPGAGDRPHDACGRGRQGRAAHRHRCVRGSRAVPLRTDLDRTGRGGCPGGRGRDRVPGRRRVHGGLLFRPDPHRLGRAPFHRGEPPDLRVVDDPATGGCRSGGLPTCSPSTWGNGPEPATPDYDTTWELKHPSEASSWQLWRAGRARIATMRPQIGWRGAAAMTVDLVAHIRRTP